MPRGNIAYRIIPEHSLIYVSMSGAVTLPEYLEFLTNIAKQDAEFREQMHTLTNAIDVEVRPPSETDGELYQSFIERVGTAPETTSQRKFALVAGENLAAFGLSRMRQVELNDSSLQLAVFSVMDEAADWLNLDRTLLDELADETKLSNGLTN